MDKTQKKQTIMDLANAAAPYHVEVFACSLTMKITTHEVVQLLAELEKEGEIERLYKGQTPIFQRVTGKEQPKKGESV